MPQPSIPALHQLVPALHPYLLMLFSPCLHLARRTPPASFPMNNWVRWLSPAIAVTVFWGHENPTRVVKDETLLWCEKHRLCSQSHHWSSARIFYKSLQILIPVLVPSLLPAQVTRTDYVACPSGCSSNEKLIPSCSTSFSTERHFWVLEEQMCERTAFKMHWWIYIENKRGIQHQAINNVCEAKAQTICSVWSKKQGKCLTEDLEGM